MKRIIFILLPLLLLCSCSRYYGISIIGNSQSVPKMEDLKKHIQNYPEVSEARVMRKEGGRPLTLTGIKKPDQVEYVHYTGKQIFGSLFFKTDYKGDISYNHSYLWRFQRPPQDKLNATWGVMKKIEEDLEYQFGVGNHSNNTKTTFIGVKPNN